MSVQTASNVPQICLAWMKSSVHGKKVGEICPYGFEHPLLKNFFQTILHSDFIACLVAEDAADRKNIIGYVVYRYSDGWIYILDLAVLPEYEEFRAKLKIIEKLIERLREKRRACIVIDVRERSSVLQAVLKHCEFKARKVLRNFYQSEDAYRMVYEANGGSFSLDDFENEIDLGTI